MSCVLGPVMCLGGLMLSSASGRENNSFLFGLLLHQTCDVSFLAPLFLWCTDLDRCCLVHLCPCSIFPGRLVHGLYRDCCRVMDCNGAGWLELVVCAAFFMKIVWCTALEWC